MILRPKLSSTTFSCCLCVLVSNQVVRTFMISLTHASMHQWSYSQFFVKDNHPVIQCQGKDKCLHGNNPQFPQHFELESVSMLTHDPPPPL